MKKINYLLIALLIVGATACKKEETKTTTSTPSTPTCLIQTTLDGDGNLTTYMYDGSKRITMAKMLGASDSSTMVYTYLGNTVEVETDNGAITTYYLNSKGLADSAHAEFDGLYSLRIILTYNSAGEVTKQDISGEVFGTAITQTSTFEYVNGNVVKEISDDGTGPDETVMEYYTDKLDYGKTFNEKTTFTTAAKNLLKRETYSDDTYLEYTYTFDSNGKVLTTSEFDSSTGETAVTTNTWVCN
jgi:YD repeat-containing protein